MVYNAHKLIVRGRNLFSRKLAVPYDRLRSYYSFGHPYSALYINAKRTLRCE